VLLPLIGDEARSEENKACALPTGNEKILFIDDDESILNLAKKRLETQGYQVEAKDNPVDALELFRSSPDRLDLVITDMTMPGMTGDRLAKQILNIRPDIPVILCSGYSDRIDAEKAAVLGIRKYIEKPFNMLDFLVSIRKVLDAGRSGDPAAGGDDEK
jgi:DNA-binding NtrC family response regulator